MNRGQLRANIQSNLQDAGVTYYQDAEINTSIQDAYNIIAAKSFCIIKSVTLNWESYNYYDFIGLGVSDYLGTIAIFNIATNQWLRDDLSLRDYDRLRRDWETWNGQPMFWTPHSLKYVAIVPFLTAAVGTFTLWYWATAPTLGSDSDSPLVSSDVQSFLFEGYCTGELLETGEEPSKANDWWMQYKKYITTYKERCINVAKSDVLLRV